MCSGNSLINNVNNSHFLTLSSKLHLRWKKTIFYAIITKFNIISKAFGNVLWFAIKELYLFLA